MTLEVLLHLLREEISHYADQRTHPDQEKKRKATPKPKKEGAPGEDAPGEEALPESELSCYCRRYQRKPLIEDQPDRSSSGALVKKLRELHLTRLFDRPKAPERSMEVLSSPGQ